MAEASNQVTTDSSNLPSGYEIVYNNFSNSTKEGSPPEKGCEHRYIRDKRLTDEDREQISEDFVIPIRKLIHVTHKEAAASISDFECNDSKYVFKSKAKQGKTSATGTHATWVPTGDGKIEFTKLSKDMCVFCRDSDCGCSFIWWGIDVGEWYRNEGQEAGAFIQRLESCKIYVADFLHNPPQSTYGTDGFSIRLSTLIAQYKESRSDSDAEVCFKRGGTLRYYLEITYVIIVCMGMELPNLECINSTQSGGGEFFVHRGLLDAAGEVVDTTKVPEFKIKYLIKNIYHSPDPKKKFSWENLVFALYYPDNGQLKCEPGDITTLRVTHYTPTCHVNCSAGH